MRKEYHIIPSQRNGGGQDGGVTLALPPPMAEVVAGVEGAVE